SIEGFWTRPGDSDPANHWMNAYCNPKSSECFIQNYATVISIPAKYATNLAQAVDVASRYLGPLTTGNNIQSTRGSHMHPFQNSLSRWQNLSLDFSLSHDRPTLLAEISNHEVRFDGEIPLVGPNAPLSLDSFTFHRSFHNGEGRYTFSGMGLKSAVGVSRGDASSPAQYGLKAHLAAGGVTATSPWVIYGQGAGEAVDSYGLLLDGKFLGNVRYSQLTANLEIAARTSDTQIKDAEGLGISKVKPGVEFKIAESVSAGASRRMDILQDGAGSDTLGLFTTYDRIHVVVDTRGRSAKNGNNKVYLVTEAGFYIFDGLENSTAWGVQAFITAHFPAGKIGQLSVIGQIEDAGKIKDDPLFEVATQWGVGTQFEKTIFKARGFRTDAAVSGSVKSGGARFGVMDTPDFFLEENANSGQSQDLFTQDPSLPVYDGIPDFRTTVTLTTYF
ncbi:MAG: hypothetical protein AAB425_05660, partial [Bdellovibrionota bacterium]